MTRGSGGIRLAYGKGYSMQDMDEDSRLGRVARITAVLLGAILLVLGVVLFEGSLFETILPNWGWLLRAAVGGATMGTGLGLGAAGWTGENRFFEKLRAAHGEERSLPRQGGTETSGDVLDSKDL